MTDSIVNQVVDVLVRLCHVLTAEQAPAGDLEARLGLTPVQASSLFTVTSVVATPGTDDVAHVELTFRQPGSLSVSDLEAAFGRSRPLPRVHAHDAFRRMFPTWDRGRSHTCAVIAQLGLEPDGTERGHVTSVIVRRDIKLS